MPVPDTNTFNLNDVRTELGLGATTSLSACVAASVNTAYDPDYEPNPPTNNLLGFRNYDAIPEWWALTPCAGGATAYTRLKPSLASQRYVLPGPPTLTYTWAGTSISQASTPAGFNGSIQRTTFQNCS